MKIKFLLALFICSFSYSAEAQLNLRNYLFHFNKSELKTSFTEKIENELAGINTSDFEDFSFDFVYKFSKDSPFIKRFSLEYKRTKHFLKELPTDPDQIDIAGKIKDYSAKFGIERRFTKDRFSLLVSLDANVNFGRYEGETSGGIAGIEEVIKYSNYETGARLGLGLQYKIWWKLILSFESSILVYKYWNNDYQGTDFYVNASANGNDMLLNPISIGLGWGFQKERKNKNKNKRNKSSNKNNSRKRN